MSNQNNVILKVKDLDISIKERIFSKNESKLINTSDFSIHKNEIVLIQGPNGSGKSSILKAITAQYSNNFKVNLNIEYCNNLLELPTDYRTMYKTIGFTEQNPDYRANNAVEYVRNRIDNYLYKHEISDEDIIDMFKKFDKEYLVYKKRLSKFSGGEKRILSLVSTFMRTKADLFILDEPLNDLDFETAKKVNEHLQFLKKTSGILIISHCRMHLDADRAYLIKKNEMGGYLEELNVIPKNCSLDDYQVCHS